MDCSSCICILKLIGNGKQDWRFSLPQVTHQAERPEKKINWFMVLEMFFANAASSAGTVGFVWATVVLLGGFVTKLNQVYFWFVTILSFFQAIRRICSDEGIAKTLNMTLIAFAVKSLASNDKEAHQAGVTILHDLVHADSSCSTEALLSIRDCPDAIESLSNMVASSFEDEMPTRETAAWVVARLAVHLHVHGIHSVMRSVWSLLETRDGEVVTPYAAQVKFTQRGLEILEHLSRHACNLTVISSSQGLMAKLTVFTHVPALSDSLAFRKAKYALTVFSRLASCTGIQGINIRHEILENALLLSNIGEIILQGSTASYVLCERAMGIVDGFALDAASRDCGATRKLAVMLMGVFCSLDEENNEVQVQLAAGRALTRLTTDSKANCHAIIRQEEVLEVFKSMLSGQHGTSRRVVVANILKNLCAYAKSGCDCLDSMEKFSADNISMALTAMYQADNLIGEEMEAFLGLVLPLSKLLNATDFCVAVNGNGISSRSFVQKLKSILTQANSDRTSTNTHPGIRRFALEQVIWMAQSEAQLHCFNHFVDCGMRYALVMVQQTARRRWQENFKLSSGDLPVLEYEESLHSVALRAMELIPEEQINGQ
uniref:Uncharacterized protein n=1 Tax=Leersia perrieri TaxID=77586 RepID=A0A0D9XLB5_9ORYZ